MTHIKTVNGATLKQSAAHGGCGECQTSCQSACKTSCTVDNQEGENNQKDSLPSRSERTTSKILRRLERVGVPTLFPCPKGKKDGTYI